jgi:hypothetical protein
VEGTVTTYVYPFDPGPSRKPSRGERKHIDRFVAAFVVKKGGPPAGTWRVPRVGYCHFLKIRIDHLEAPDPDNL